MTITPEEVAKLREKATPWPWEVGYDNDTGPMDECFIEWVTAGPARLDGCREQDCANAAFIAAAHDMADLIAEQAREIAELRTQIEAADEMAKLIYEAKSLGYFNTLRERIFAAEMQYFAARGTLK